MNREIKFRIWDGKRMFLPFQSIGAGSSSQMYVLDLRGKVSLINVFGLDMQPPSQVDVQVMQYTGLNDKNGKKIYEGDVISVFDKIMPVVFDKGCWKTPHLDSNYRLWNWKEGVIEVIGNIYEHPHLLTTPSPK